jgi:hypothetical protein
VTAGVAELGTIEVQTPADLRSREPDLAVGGEAVAAEHGAVDPQPIGGQGDSGGVVEGRALQAEQPADVTTKHHPAIGGEAVALHVLIDLQDISDKGRPGVVAQLRPGAVQAAADVAADQADGASLASADGGEPAAEEHALAHLQAVSDQGRAGVVAQLRPITQEAAADVGAGQADRTAVASAGGGEPLAEEHVQADLQAVGEQRGTAIAVQVRPIAFEAAADVGAGQADRTTTQADRVGGGVAGDRCPGQSEHAAGEPVGGQRRLGGMFEPASGQADESQPGTPGEDALLQKAIFQLKVDIRSEVLQIKPTGDPGPPKPQPMRIRVSHQPPAQDIADHGRRDDPRLPPGPHRGLINRLVLGQIKPFPASDVLDQRLLHRSQSSPGPSVTTHEL